MTSSALETAPQRVYFRLGIILLVFPIILVYLLPQVDLVSRFFAGDRTLWLRFWIIAVILEWVTLSTVVASFRNRRSSLKAVGFPLVMSRSQVYVLATLVLGSVVLAVAGSGRPQDFLSRVPVGFQMFIPPSGIEARLFWIFVSFTAAVTEETMWRGIAITELRKLTGSTLLAVVISSASFAFFHGGLDQGWVAMTYRFVIALVLAAVYLRMRGLWAVMIVHFLMDVSALVAVQFN